MKPTVYHYEMTSFESLYPPHIPAELELQEVKDAQTNARFYREVGQTWQWIDRLIWSDEEWEKWVQRDEIITLVARYQGKEAGYVEMEKQDGGSVEILYFGLLPEMIGKRLGGATLALAVARAWEMNETARVWLHTCTQDHAHARSNYEKRGFRLFLTEQEPE